MIENSQSQRLSKSVLHDIIKSVINYYPLQVIEICKHSGMKSNILSGKTWLFQESRQEQINTSFRQADVVWFYEDTNHNTFFVVHEIKTGGFDISDIHRKYHTGMNVQIWVWAFSSKIPKCKPPVTMKIIPIEFISSYVVHINESTIQLLKRDCSDC